ncbi:RNA-binding protein with serine-rich domain 1, partial [Sarcoptes scabiei]
RLKMGSSNALKNPKNDVKDQKRARSVDSRSSASSRSRSRSSSRSSSSSSSSSRSSSSRSVSSHSSRSSRSSKRSNYRRRFRSTSPKRSGSRKAPPTPPRPTRLYIGRLTRNVTENHINEIFSSFGKVLSVEMPTDRVHHHLNRGFAYVEYENENDAAKAVKLMDGGQIDGQEISASKIDLQKARGVPPPRRSTSSRRPLSPVRRRRSPPPRRSPRRRFTRSRSRSPIKDRRRRSSGFSSSSSR